LLPIAEKRWVREAPFAGIPPSDLASFQSTITSKPHKLVTVINFLITIMAQIYSYLEIVKEVRLGHTLEAKLEACSSRVLLLSL